MQPQLQELKRKLRHETVFIVGGGKSLQSVDFKRLQDELTICINDAYRFFPNATALFWVDDSWISEHYDSVMAHNCQLRFTSKHSQAMPFDMNNNPKGIANSCILARTGDFGYDKNYNCVMGNNSGTQALNLAVNMKPKTIVLLGYDMKTTGHFHDGKRPVITQDIYRDLFIPSTNALADGIKAANVEIDIVNANPDSGLNCFRFDDYTNYLK
jgi:hypothetical protein